MAGKLKLFSFYINDYQLQIWTQYCLVRIKFFFMYSLSELILFWASLLYSTITYFMSTMLLDSVILATYQWTKRQTHTALWEHLSAKKICNKITNVQIPSNAIISAMRQSKNNLKHEVTNIGNSCRGHFLCFHQISCGFSSGLLRC